MKTEHKFQLLLEAASRLTDDEIDKLASKTDDELAGEDPRPVLRALRELGQGNTGRRPNEEPPDPLR